MAKLYWKIKENGKWAWYAFDNYKDINLQCECGKCRLQTEEEE